MNPQVRKFLIWSGALVVVLIAVALIRGKTKVAVPVETGQ